MVQTGAQWRLVATRSGTNDLQRKIAISHPKELCFALRESRLAACLARIAHVDF
tara:strand:+ start:1129 stop:1290 length:162 start_codon:yes stop_codon:yes gene_type:complete